MTRRLWIVCAAVWALACEGDQYHRVVIAEISALTGGSSLGTGWPEIFLAVQEVGTGRRGTVTVSASYGFGLAAGDTVTMRRIRWRQP